MDNDNFKTGVQTEVSRLQYVIPFPDKHIEPEGKLKACMESVAIWYFLVCAHHTVEKTPRQITLTDEEDQQVNLNNIVYSIGLITGLTASQIFDSEIVRRAYAEAEDCGLSIDYRVRSFINSGGQTYAKYDRDPDSHG